MDSAALPAGRFFFPLDLKLDLRSESYSPWLLERLEWAGGNVESYKKATQVAKKCLALEISERELRNLTEKFGRERAALRDAEVSRFQQRKLPPRHLQPPSVGVVSLDGGRAQIRASGSPPGVHDPAWTEVKVANLSTYTDVRFQADPQPEPPGRYLDPPQVVQLVEGLKGAAGKRPNQKAKSPVEVKASRDRPPKVPGPERKVRTVVATAQKTEAFGMMVATDAAGRGFYQAKKKAALGDGGAWIWALVALHFVGFVPILDFVHLMAYLYEAAVAAYRADAKKAWRLYVKLVRTAWAGKAGEVKGLLERESKRLGDPPKGVPDDDPRKILSRAVGYVENNRDKMDYARYRREGLPISTAPVESLIKEVNKRVKGSEKFWTCEGLEAVLQVRAAYLSHDDRVEKFWSRRPPARAVGTNRLKPAA